MVTVADVEAYAPNINPALATSLIAATMAAIEGRLQRSLSVQAYAGEMEVGSGTYYLSPRAWPIVEVTSCQVLGEEVDLAEISVTGHNRQFLYRQKGWPVWHRGPYGLASETVDSDHPSVTLTYTAGWSTLPADLVQAIAMSVAKLGSKKVGSAGSLIQETTPGGWSRRWAEEKTAESEELYLTPTILSILSGPRFLRVDL